jgi:hypothetical protein
MEVFYLYLNKIIRIEKLTIPSKKNCDLVLDIMPIGEQTFHWSYYFACHKARCLFWLDKYNASSSIYGVESPAHISSSSSFTILSLYSLIYVQSIIWRIYTGTSPLIHQSSCKAELGFLVLISSYRNHWSLFPAVFKGRRLSPHVYDELMGMLAHGCVGESVRQNFDEITQCRYQRYFDIKDFYFTI